MGIGNTIKISKLFLICVVFIFGIIIAKLFYVSYSSTVDGINMQEFALSRTTEKKTLYASRGTVYDVSGEALALNVNSYTVIAYLSEARTSDDKDPKHVVDKSGTAEALAPLINMESKDILTLLNHDAYQVELGPGGRNITELTKQKIEELDLPGIDFLESSKRYYPYDDFASYIIGYAKKNDNGDIVGEMGIESYFDEELSGTDGYTEYQKDAYGYQIANSPALVEDPESGNDIYLTIDSNIQMFLDNALETMLRDNESDWATITIADAKTGAIVGSASNPTFNPNKLDITNYNNPLVAYTYEPGSTMKIFSFASAIEEGKYKGDEKYSSGTIEVDNFKIQDWNTHGWGSITYDVGFTYSSNVAATLLAQSLGKEKIVDYYKRLGFSNLTEVELYGELEGTLRVNYDSELANVSFGQGMTVTPIQMIQSLTTLTNDGVLLKPYIVDKIVDSNTGEVIKQNERSELGRIYSKETIDKITSLMDLTVNALDPAATGKVFQTDLVRVAGKTGTAQYILENGKYSTGDYSNIRSFAGFFPYENPEYIIYVAIKDLHGTSKTLGNMVKSVVESVAKYKNLSERETNKDETKLISLDSYISTEVNVTKDKLVSLGLNPIIIGNGDRIIKQYPSRNTLLIKGSKVYLMTNASEIYFPNTTNFTRTDFINLANLLNIKFKISGSGKTMDVSLKEGDLITKDTILSITYKEVEENAKEKEEQEE